MDEELDCEACGACCVSNYDAEDYVSTTTEEAALIAAAGHERLISRGTRLPTLRTTYDTHGNCRCAALSGVVGDSVSCTIYELRPLVCQKFTAGTGACYMARRAAGLAFSDR
jgi:Fe-S-cluster containining protein